MTLDQYVANVLNADEFASRSTPPQRLTAALRSCESLEFAQGASLALSSIRMVAAVVPESVTQSQLLAMLHDAIATAERECLQRIRNNEVML